MQCSEDKNVHYKSSIDMFLKDSFSGVCLPLCILQSPVMLQQTVSLLALKVVHARKESSTVMLFGAELDTTWLLSRARAAS